MRRAYRLEQSEVRRRDRLRGPRVAPVADMDAVELPQLLVDVEKAFTEAGSPEWMPTRDLVAWLRDQGYTDLDEGRLGAGLGKRVNSRRRRTPSSSNPIAGYLLADVRAEMDRL